MACTCRGPWVNTACRDHGVDANDHTTASEQRDIDNAWGDHDR